MGKQVNFYMLPEDELLFLRFLCQEPTMVFLQRRSATPDLQVIPDPLSSFQSLKTREVLIWNTTFPIQEADITETHMRKYDTERYTYVETGELAYFINKVNAPVLEFSRSFVRDDGRLVVGRIWAEMYRLAGDALIHKGEAFEAWYDRIARWLRRHFSRVSDLYTYLGPKALQWWQEGGLLAR
jgi:hypothetical protein